MLSDQPIVDTNSVSRYYCGEQNYYFNGVIDKDVTFWSGKGAENLGLQGHIQQATFEQLLHGKLATGEQLGVKTASGFKHRPGVDLTFSAPKSVSIVSLVGKDERVKDAVLTANRLTMAHIEKNYACARVTEKGKTRFVATDNLVVASFLHELSRENEPQLHVHNVVLNMTQTVDRVWRALGSSRNRYGKFSNNDHVKGFLESIRHDKVDLGARFRLELAYQLHLLGYEVRITGKDCLFEIEGIPEHAIDALSTRSHQIKEYLKDKIFDSPRAKAIAALGTKSDKIAKTQDELRSGWDKKIKQAGRGNTLLVIDEVVRKAKQMTPQMREQQVKHRIENAKRALFFAMSSLSEGHATFSEKKLRREAMNVDAVGTITSSDLADAINEAVSNKDLLVIGDTNHHARCYTTRETVEKEKQIVELLTKPHMSNKPMASTKKINKILESQTVTSDYKNLIKTIMQRHEQGSCVMGAHRNARENFTKELTQAAKKAHHLPIVLTPDKLSQQAFKAGLHNDGGLIERWLHGLLDVREVDNVSHFTALTEHQVNERSVVKAKRLIVFDEAHRMPIDQLRKAMVTADKINARVVLVMDDKAAFPWQTGRLAPVLSPLKLPAHDTKEKELLVSDGSGAGAVQCFPVVDRNTELRRLQIVNHYVRLSSAKQAESQIVAPTKAVAERMNIMVHNQLIKQEQLCDERHIVVSKPVHLSKSRRLLSQNYPRNAIVTFNRDYKQLGIKSNESFCVWEHYNKRNEVILRDSKTGRHIRWDPEKIAGQTENAFRITEQEGMAVAVGEKLQVNQSNNIHRLATGASLVIEKFYKHSLICRDSAGKQYRFNTKDHNPIPVSYAYATTVAQLKQVKSTLLVDIEASRYSTNANQLRRLFNHATKQITLYTDDLTLLRENFSHTKLPQSALNTLYSCYLDQNADPCIKSCIAVVEKLFKQDQQADTLPRDAQEAYVKARAQESVAFAIAHLSEREAVFSSKDIIKHAASLLPGICTPKMIDAAFTDAVKNGELVENLVYKGGRHEWTTKEALALEKATLKLAQFNKGQFDSIVSQSTRDAFLQKPNALNEEQKKAINAIVSTRDIGINIQGLSGAGKTTMMIGLRDVLHYAREKKEQVPNLLCLAPTHPAVKELTSRGLEAQTLASFLAEKSNAQLSSTPTLFVLDESSMVSTQKMHDFLTKVGNRHRCVIMGDVRQIPAIEAGKPSTLLHGELSTTNLKNIIRQANNPILLEAIKSVYRHDIDDAIKILSGNIRNYDKNSGPVGFVAHQDMIANIKAPTLLENSRPEKTVLLFKKDLDKDNISPRLVALTADYMSQTESERKESLVVALTNNERSELNSIIRYVRQVRGEVSSNSLETSILVSYDMTTTQRKHCGFYPKNAVIRFGRYEPSIDANAGSYWANIGRDEKNSQALILRDENGRQARWMPSQCSDIERIEIFERDERDIAVGDWLRFTRSDKEVQRVGGAQLEVVRVDQDGFLVRDANQKEIKLKANRLADMHVDYRYALTVHSCQGATCRKTFAYLSSYHEELATRTTFLVLISRATHDLNIYTDNVAKLVETINEKSVDKTSALEAVDQIKIQDIEKKIADMVHHEPSTETHRRSTRTVAQVNKAPARWDLSAIQQALTANTESICERLLGEPKSRQGATWRFGERAGGKGSLVVTIQGEKRGCWHDFKEGTGGHLLQLIQHQGGLTFPEAVKEAINLLGSAESTFKHHESQSKTSPVVLEPLHQIPQDKTTLRKIARAKKLAAESVPVKGTLAERYLKEHRKITDISWSRDVRFHNGIHSRINKGTFPALLSIARNSDGEIQSVESVFLERDTAIARKNLDVPKQTFGPKSGTWVALQPQNTEQNRVAMVAEGVVTGLSAKMAFPDRDVFVTLGSGSFKKAPIPKADKVIILLDNDGENVAPSKSATIFAQRLKEANIEVTLAKPEQAGFDYNDLLVKGSLDAVKVSIEQAKPYQTETELARQQAIVYQKSKTENEAVLQANYADILKDKDLNASELQAQEQQKSSQAYEEYMQW